VTDSITPPPELVGRWIFESDIPGEDMYEGIATRAAQWGADQELEACCDHMRDHQWGFVDLPNGTKIHRAIYLQQTRRPKPPSLKEQALVALNKGCFPSDDEIAAIRRALEALPE
jgi:hypothetical protein